VGVSSSLYKVGAMSVGSASDIKLLDVASGDPFPSAPSGSVLLSSAPLSWRGIIVEWHRLAPQELPEHYIDCYGLSISTSPRRVPFGWRNGSGPRDRFVSPGEFHLLTPGDVNAPRWSETWEEVTIVLAPRFVADVVRDGLPPERVELITQRAASDPTVAYYSEAFRAEIAQGAPRGGLYAETLAIGLTLHLLANYGVTKPRTPTPRGKLNAFQLRSVMDFIQDHLEEDVAVLTLAEKAHVSAFHFARQFRATVGLTPHQFVLRQRVQRASRLIKAGKLPLAQVAVQCGFHDQAHLTRVFRSIVGTTPGAYSRRA
jgi:AraC family transcriptional regulator